MGGKCLDLVHRGARARLDRPAGLQELFERLRPEVGEGGAAPTRDDDRLKVRGWNVWAREETYLVSK